MTTQVEKVTLVSTERVVVETPSTSHVITGGLLPLSNSISASTDVDLSNLSDGSVLVYQQNTGRWQATTLLEKQTVNGGFF